MKVIVVATGQQAVGGKTAVKLLPHPHMVKSHKPTVFTPEQSTIPSLTTTLGAPDSVNVKIEPADTKTEPDVEDVHVGSMSAANTVKSHLEVFTMSKSFWAETWLNALNPIKHNKMSKGFFIVLIIYLFLLKNAC